MLDAVFYNLALILQSHLRTGKGKVHCKLILKGIFFTILRHHPNNCYNQQVRILYNSISDVQGQQLYPYLEARSCKSHINIFSVERRSGRFVFRHRHMAGATYLVSRFVFFSFVGNFQKKSSLVTFKGSNSLWSKSNYGKSLPFMITIN